MIKVVIQGEDSFVFEDIGDKEHRAELPQARSVDRQKTVRHRMWPITFMEWRQMYMSIVMTV